MFKTDRDFQFDPLPQDTLAAYKISVNDLIVFRLFTNDGFKLIDLSSGELSANQQIGTNSIQYLVELDGTVEFPTIGKTPIAGLTLKEAELMLEAKYGTYYKKPYVLIEVVNNRVIVSTGEGGKAQVITLVNNNVTVIEALALAGGIADRGIASKIKVIRKEKNQFKIYKIDLSTIDGLQAGNMIVQADDIIYIDPTPQIASELVREIAPIISLISSSLFILSVINSR